MIKIISMMIDTKYLRKRNLFVTAAMPLVIPQVHVAMIAWRHAPVCGTVSRVLVMAYATSSALVPVLHWVGRLDKIITSVP